MKIFVTGATGVLGKPVTRMLLDTGHTVRALARSPVNESRLRNMGAEPVRAGLFEASSLRDAVAGCDAVFHLATHIPPSNQALRPESWLENDRIRIEGTRNLVDVALAGSSVSTFIYPSVVFVYPDGGERWLDARTRPVSSPLLASSLAAEEEVLRFTQAGRRGIVLRMGWFYGPTAASTQDLFRAAKWGIAMVFGPAKAYQPLIWVEDAAVAVIDAHAKAPAGIYDVVDDEPLQRRELASILAAAAGRRRLFRPPSILLWLLGGKRVMHLTRSQRVSNQKFKEATGWTPTVASARFGLKLTALEP